MLELKNISKKYENFYLKDICFKVADGEYFVILGESGAGKSVILEIIAGLIKQDKGLILFNGTNIGNTKIQDRKFGLVFQDFAVFPHISVKGNIAYALKTGKKNLTNKDINKKVEQLAEKMEISGLLNRKPNTLSGGELQRVALARTLALEPRLLLLDEPLSSLDVQLRSELQSLLRKINKEGISIIHVTHNYDEAIALAHRVGIINNGKIIQTGTPKEVFHNPASKFVANFTGIRNFYNARYISENKVIAEEKTILTVKSCNNNFSGFAMFRAEDVILSKSEIVSSLTNKLEGKVTDIIPLPDGMEIVVDAGIKIVAKITLESFEKMRIAENKTLWVSFKAAAIRLV